MKRIKLKVKSATDTKPEGRADIASKSRVYAAEFEAAVGTLIELADQFNCLCKAYNEKTGERYWTTEFVDDGGVRHSPNEFGGIDFKGFEDWLSYAHSMGNHIASCFEADAHN